MKYITRIALESNQRDKTTDEKAKRLSLFKQCFNFKSTSESDTLITHQLKYLHF